MMHCTEPRKKAETACAKQRKDNAMIPSASLNLFHLLVQKWFKSRFGSLTDIQTKAWPVIAKGAHVLITAPTGSGKTLSAFLWALNQLITNQLPAGATRVIYVSPLKALNNDIQRNLLAPLGELQQVFEQSRQPFPRIHVLTRSGDTPQSERRRMLRQPPEILITTPESLNLMLSSKGGRSILSQVAVVIMDEIHALISEKRGTYLMTAVDRLVPLAGEFQRIALSATVRPLETVAAFIGGFRIEKGQFEPTYLPRDVETVRSTTQKQYHLTIRLVEETFAKDQQKLPAKKEIWTPLVAEIKTIIAGNRSTLIFVNSRKLCEKITYLVNRDESFPLAYAHHGSLSRELRYTVEAKLKQGELKAIVATNSLELGIDIGDLDAVVLIQSPSSIASALQRLGRAGHQVDAASRGVLFPTHPHDFLEAAVLVAGIRAQDIEAAHPVECPLDVLAQIIVSMTGTETWQIDRLYDILKTSRPYQNLNREQFDLVLSMLAGRYADTRIRELKTRVSIDRIDNTVRARKGALLSLYMSGGVIPDRGYFNLRHLETNARIGELDEEFVWEARRGQIFTLGTQNWKIERITHNDVLVKPAGSGKTAPPFWIAETFHRGFHFSEKIGRFLEWINENLDSKTLNRMLQRDYGMESVSAKALVRFLSRQKEKSGCDLPHRHHLLVEQVASGPGGAPGNQIILHTYWGGRINRPFAMALEAAWEETFQQQLETFADNNCIYMVLPQDIPAETLLVMVTQDRVTALIRRRLEGSGFFGARFRECAGRALLISHNKMNQRMPLWISRLKSKKLFESIAGYDDFPILLETWRTCLLDMFDLKNLHQLLAELESGEIRWSTVTGSYPSPMAMSGSWRQINEYMYRDDSRSDALHSALRDDLISGLISSPGFRPDFHEDLVAQFETKRKRESRGYAPETPEELLDWVVERIMIPQTEWEVLLLRIEADHEIAGQDLLTPLKNKIGVIKPPATETRVVIAMENAARVIQTLYGDSDRLTVETILSDPGENMLVRDPLGLHILSDREELEQERMRLVGEWLSFYGPMSLLRIREKIGINAKLLDRIVNDLAESDRILRGNFFRDLEDEHICDRENFGILLRMKRLAAIPSCKPSPVSLLPYFIANIQHVVKRQADKERLFAHMEQLSCFCLPAAVWESDILPSRLDQYDTSWLDTAMQESDLMWIGCGREKICFCFQVDLDLIQTAEMRSECTKPDDVPGDHSDAHKHESDLGLLFPDRGARYDFSTLLRRSRGSASDLSRLLWDFAWQGMVTNDTAVSMRKGIENKFAIPRHAVHGQNMVPRHERTRRSGHHRGYRGRFSTWKGALPFSGYWRKIEGDVDEADLLEAAERTKERIRLLLERYGILFRELLLREQKAFQWRQLFRSLRLMELSGEIVSGYFFSDIPGPQFMSHKGFQILQRLSPDEEIYWMNAVDPASLCGIQIQKLKDRLPRRLVSTHLVYCGDRLVLVSRRHGRDLTFHVGADDPEIQSYLGVLRHLLSRQFQPRRQITVETINDIPAAKSPFVDVLQVSFDVLTEYKQVVLYRKIEK
jgi:ATP-dependent helicase Lhr and Lhr-like helicase